MLSADILGKKDVDLIDLVLEAIRHAGELQPTLICYSDKSDPVPLEFELTGEKYHSPILKEFRKFLKQYKAKRWIAILPLCQDNMSPPYEDCNSWRIWAVTRRLGGQYATIQTYRNERGLIVDLQENHPRIELKGYGTKWIIQ